MNSTTNKCYIKAVQKNIICKNIDEVIKWFSNNDEIDVFNGVFALKYVMAYFYNPFGFTDWFKLCEEFFDEKKRNAIASRKLSRKLYRANHKVSSGKHSFVEDTQPWYNKDYKNKKYNKNIWRR